jgi:hypothetical protein
LVVSNAKGEKATSGENTVGDKSPNTPDAHEHNKAEKSGTGQYQKGRESCQEETHSGASAKSHSYRAGQRRRQGRRSKTKEKIKRLRS